MDDLVTAPFRDHVRWSFRGPVDRVVQFVIELFAGHFAEASEFTRSDVQRFDRGPCGNFGSQVIWSWRGLTLFRVLTPGQSTRGVGHVIMDGSSCTMLAEHGWLVLADEAERQGWLLKRSDPAVDDDRGVIGGLDDLASLYHAGAFDPLPHGPRRLFDPRDPRQGTASTGWTLYLGRRTGAQFARIYHKHSEVLAKRGPAEAALIPEHRVRFELELKSGRGLLSWDVVRHPGSAFVAHSRAFAELAAGAQRRRLFGVARRQAEHEAWQLLAHCRNSYGPTIARVFHALGGDDDAAVQLVHTLLRPEGRACLGLAEIAGGGVPDREYVSDV